MLPEQLGIKRYVVSDIAQLAYAYDFLLLDAQEVAVYVDDVLTTNYTLSGLGVVTGGNVTFFGGLPLGAIVLILRTTSLTQLLTLTVGSVLPSSAIEGAHNRAVMLIQDIHEILQRIPQLDKGISDTLRNLLFPEPSAGSPLIGWNAAGTALTLYPNALSVQEISPAVGHTYGRTVLTFAATNGALELRNNAAQLANTRTLGVTLVVDTAFSTAGGMTGFIIGDDELPDRWSHAPVALTAGTLTGDGNFGPSPERVNTSAAPVVIRAIDGAFGPTGALTAVVHWRTLRNSGGAAGSGGAGGIGSATYSVGFASQTVVTILGATHALATSMVHVQVFDDGVPAALIEAGSVTVHPTTFDVTVTFATAQSGVVVIKN